MRTKINWVNWKRVLNVIAKQPEHRVKMDTWFSRTIPYLGSPASFRNDCGTSGCIGGWTILSVSRAKTIDIYDDDNTRERAQALLGLNVDQADHVFYGGWQPDSINYWVTNGKVGVVAYMLKALNAKKVLTIINEQDLDTAKAFISKFKVPVKEQCTVQEAS